MNGVTMTGAILSVSQDGAGRIRVIRFHDREGMDDRRVGLEWVDLEEGK